MKKYILIISVFVMLIQTYSVPAFSAELDKTLKPSESDDSSLFFENVVAVQRKAKKKAGKFLFFPYFSLDFSDSPFTQYGLVLDAGYAIGEFWEVYLSYVPFYITNERNLSKQVKELTLQNGEKAVIATEKAKSSIGIEINWVPIYGKDSWGPYGIIRSDTFFNFGISSMKFEKDSGMKFKVMVGKTFFISDMINFRLQTGAAMVDSFTQQSTGTIKKATDTLGLLEGGLVFYF
ncbi:hypothetical protein CIK05_11685 [Bdellovibrio sp. qaytius]|nr:hypothetical protein CIK05_11685 [Bdellovibrio sp. qaytius]